MATKLWAVNKPKNISRVIVSLELILMFGGTTGLSTHVDIRPTVNSETALHEAVPYFAGPIQNVTVAVGREAVLSCVIKELGNYKVCWMRVEDQTILTLDKRVVTYNPRISVSQDGPSTWQLRIRHLRESDRGCYMCQINTSTMKKQFGCIDVHVPPDISDSQSSGDMWVQEGENATLVCKATGKPQPKIFWKREDGHNIVIKKGSRNITKVETFVGESLTLQKLDRKQMGSYFCIASNDVPPAVSKRITLNINFKPSITVPNQLLGAPLGTDVNLECFVEAYPNSIIYWLKNREDAFLTGENYVIKELRISAYRVHAMMTIANFTKRDLGTYMCVATNSLGKSEGSIRLYEIKLATLSPTSTTTPLPTTSKPSTTTSEAVVIRKDVLAPRSTTSPKITTTLIKENLIPIDRSEPKEYFYNHASSSTESLRSRNQNMLCSFLPKIFISLLPYLYSNLISLLEFYNKIFDIFLYHYFCSRSQFTTSLSKHRISR